MNRSVQILCLVGLVLCPVSAAHADPRTYPVGDWMCPCPGGPKPMGGAANCEEVCYGKSTGSGTPRRDYEAERRAREDAAKAEATTWVEKGLEAADLGDLDMALRLYEKAKRIWPAIGTYKSRSGGYTGIDGLIAEIKRQKRDLELTTDFKNRTTDLADRLREEQAGPADAANPGLALKDIKEQPASGDVSNPENDGGKDIAARASRKAVAGKQLKALGCAIGELRELANGMGEEGAMLRAELNAFLDNLRAELNKPCSGRPETQNIQTLSLSGLTKGAKRKEDHLEGNVLVTRDEKTCEVRLDVQHASSLKSASSRSSGRSSNEGQSLIRMDNAGKILAAEAPAGVEKCLARLSAEKP